MCQLHRIAVPTPTPPTHGPWRIRYTFPDGTTGLASVSYEYRATAEDDAESCRRACREGCSYDVVPDPGGAKIFV